MLNEDKQKSLLRKSLIQQRAAIDPVDRTDKNRSILANLASVAELVSAQNIFCFISYGTEVDTRTLIDWLLQQGKHIAVPRIIAGNEMIAVSFNGWSDVDSGPLGIPAPCSTNEFTAAIDICITPGLGFTLGGQRLGYGLGYYDKWLARHRVRHKLALCYECQLVKELPVDQYDIPVDMLVTENRIIRV